MPSGGTNSEARSIGRGIGNTESARAQRVFNYGSPCLQPLVSQAPESLTAFLFLGPGYQQVYQ